MHGTVFRASRQLARVLLLSALKSQQVVRWYLHNEIMCVHLAEHAECSVLSALSNAQSLMQVGAL